MPKFTKEQLKAINEEGTNIIVSAGAGSGKTAVLTQRVIRKIKDGIGIDRILVLTFTKDAASEMKDRIRRTLETENLNEALDYIDSSYITTFDSYALSIVKKYFYLLNVSKDISIIDSSIITIYKNKIIDSIFEESYKDTSFGNFIGSYSVKDDKDIKKLIIKISNKMDLLLNKKEYLDTYLDTFYSEEKINNISNNYNNLINDKLNKLKVSIYNLSDLLDEKSSGILLNECKILMESKNYNEIKENINVTFPRLYKASEEAKEAKENCNSLRDELINYTRFESLEKIKELYLNTKNHAEQIIKIIKRLDENVSSFKNETDRYEFIDIALMAIKVVKENESVRKELKEYYNEIMIDEYQDTNDLQEEFINLISNDNVYAVGDIKQSIYRFRNANPYLFRDKYTKYENKENGIKIDLLKNFRSRKETIEDINNIFNRIMDLSVGDAEYEKSHNMIFGNMDYEQEGFTDNDNHLEVINYEYEDKEFTKEEIEAFIVSKDIKNKVHNNYQVYDKETGKLRNITYNDFVILIDRVQSFETIKKIFEYEGIPLSINKDELLTEENEILIIKNIISLILKVKDKTYDTEFKYYMTSILRSFLFRESDEYIFSLFLKGRFYESELYKKISNLTLVIDEKTPYELINKIYEEFNIYENIILTGEVTPSFVRYDYIKEISLSLTKLGFTNKDFVDHLNEMLTSKIEIKYSLNTKTGDSVNLMTIHKSKGLEFPICYYIGLYKEFNKQELKDMFIFDSELGIILPFITEEIEGSILKDLLKIRNNRDDISEKIRLLYVSLTRAREKMIVISPKNEKEDNNEFLVNEEVKLKYNSFLSIFNSVKNSLSKYEKEIKIDSLNLTNKYKIINENKILDNIDTSEVKLECFENNIEYGHYEEKRFSKVSNELITEENRFIMDKGIEAHYILETTDFKNPDNEYALSLLEKLPDINDAQIYKEYEFIYTENNITSRGVIDLLLEYEDNIKIIDYKLSNIDDENYNNQLKGYKNYISKLTNKPISIYLYSLNTKTLKKLDE